MAGKRICQHESITYHHYSDHSAASGEVKFDNAASWTDFRSKKITGGWEYRSVVESIYLTCLRPWVSSTKENKRGATVTLSVHEFIQQTSIELYYAPSTPLGNGGYGDDKEGQSSGLPELALFTPLH